MKLLNLGPFGVVWLSRRATEQLEQERAARDALHSLRDQSQSDVTIEDVYADRNLAVQLAAMYAGPDACWTTDQKTPGWPVLVITTPEGQVSWHVPADQRYVTTPTPDDAVTWDGHTTGEKHGRIRRLLAGSDRWGR